MLNLILFLFKKLFFKPYTYLFNHHNPNNFSHFITETQKGYTFNLINPLIINKYIINETFN